MNIYEENIVWKRRPFNLTKMFGNWKDNVQLGELKESKFLLLWQGHLLRVKCRNRLSGKLSWWKWNLKSGQHYFMFFFEEGNDLFVIWFMIPFKQLKLAIIHYDINPCLRNLFIVFPIDMERICIYSLINSQVPLKKL